MNPVLNFLEKIKKQIGNKTEETELIKKIIKEEIGPTPFFDFEFRDGSVFVKAQPAVKNEIFLKKKKILETLVGKGLKIHDLR